MAGRIFVNYRRDDSASQALNVALYLEVTFGKRNVFLDIDRMRAGQSFPVVLEERLAACEVMLAIIGPHWLTLRDDQGQRRLDDPDDWVRLEIATALASGTVVIPVLVGGATLPRKVELPPALQALSDQQAVTLTTTGFRNEMAGLARDIRALPRPLPWGRLGSILAAGLALVLIGWVVLIQIGVPLPGRALLGPMHVEIEAKQAEERRSAEARLAAERKARADAEARAKELANEAEKARRDEEAARKRAENEARLKDAAEAEARRKADEADKARAAAAKSKREADERAAADVPRVEEQPVPKIEGETDETALQRAHAEAVRKGEWGFDRSGQDQ